GEQHLSQVAAFGEEAQSAGSWQQALPARLTAEISEKLRVSRPPIVIAGQLRIRPRAQAAVEQRLVGADIAGDEGAGGIEHRKAVQEGRPHAQIHWSKTGSKGDSPNIDDGAPPDVLENSGRHRPGCLRTA